jgi:hypothetical protein
MKPLRPLAIIFFLVTLFCSPGFGQCKKFSAETKVIHTTNEGANGAIEIEIRGISTDELSVNLFGPKRKNRLGLSELVINGLEKGDYLLVLSPKKEGDNICPVSINVTIN